MQHYQSYVVSRRYKGNGLTSKQMNLPYGSVCRVVEDGGHYIIVCRDRRVCYVDSDTAYQYFAQNDDGQGLERGDLTRKILNRLAFLHGHTQMKNEIWNKIWDDSICLKYKRNDSEDYWLWNYDFYQASIDDLKYIANLVGAK